VPRGCWSAKKFIIQTRRVSSLLNLQILTHSPPQLKQVFLCARKINREIIIESALLLIFDILRTTLAQRTVKVIHLVSFSPSIYNYDLRIYNCALVYLKLLSSHGLNS